MVSCNFCGAFLDSDEQCNCTEALSFRLLHYGKMLIDNEKNLSGLHIRQRLIKYQGKRYLHLMINGDLIFCSKENNNV